MLWGGRLIGKTLCGGSAKDANVSACWILKHPFISLEKLIPHQFTSFWAAPSLVVIVWILILILIPTLDYRPLPSTSFHVIVAL